MQGQRIWDDEYLALENPFIKSPLLILESFRHYLFQDSYSPHYRPVQNISYFLDYWLWNTNEFGFHLTNVLLHIGSGVLLYFLLQQIVPSFCFRRLPLISRQRAIARQSWIGFSAFLIALLWTVHPVHSAAIDYISGRADSLTFLFACAAWLLFNRASRAIHPIARALVYFLAGFSGLLALCARETAILWIVIFLAHLFFVEQQIPRRARVWALVSCGVLVLIYAGLRELPANRPSSPAPPGATTSARAVLMARALGDYGRLLVWPSKLYMERTVSSPVHHMDLQTWRDTIGTEYLSILGLIVLMLLAAGAIKNDRWRAMRVFGAVWFLVSYLPISNIVELNATVAEHWLYLPSVGLFIFIAGWAFQLPLRFRTIIATLAGLAVVALGVRSFIRSGDWANPETFYQRTFAAGSRSARVAVNLGRVYAHRGAYAEAEKMFRSVLDQYPDYPIAQNNLASVLAREGKNKEAESLFAIIEENSQKTREEYPRTWIGALNLARVRHSAHNDDSALAILDRAHSDYPEVWELISLKAEIVRERQGPEAALSLIQDFAQKNWWHYGAALALGRLYAQSGNEALAENALSLASRLDIHDSEALRLLAEMRLRENRLEEAFQIQRRAVARQPDQPSLYVALSDILTKMGRDADARVELVKAAQLRSLVPNPALPN